MILVVISNLKRVIQVKSILVVCAYCMSVSSLIKNMTPLAQANDASISMGIIRSSQLKDQITQSDLILVEPSLNHMKSHLRNLARTGAKPDIPIFTIDYHDFATANGPKVWATIATLL